LVQVLASDYRKLAISFQIATEQENVQATSEKLSSISDIATIEETYESDKPQEGEIEFSQDNKTVETNTPEGTAYSLSALADSKYDITEGLSSINECIENLKTYNWYKQNPAINKLSTLSFNNVENTQQNRDSFFVLGRNVLQSADGTAGSAMHFLDNLHYSISGWPKPFQQAFIDGCLYEVFFNSLGKIRPKTFKSTYFQTIVDKVNEMDITNGFDFINRELEKKNEGRFVPKVNSDEKYTFEFSFGKMDESYGAKTISLKINGLDSSDTFKTDFGLKFCYPSNIKNALSSYYAIPEENIKLVPLPDEIKTVNHIAENDIFYH
jgi:hypothetical protein